MKNLKINLKKLKALVLAGSLSLASVATGCANTDETAKTSTVKEVSTNTDSLENTEATVNAVDEYTKYYNQISDLEKDVVDFGKDVLPHGFVEVNESNAKDMAEVFADAYIMLNITELDGKTIAILNQDMDLTAGKITEDYMNFSLQVAKYSQIQTPETAIDFSNIILDENDLEFITNLSNEISYLNVATTKEEINLRIKNINAIKDELLVKASENGMMYNSSTLYLALNMIIDADATAKSMGGVIFENEETKQQFYTTFYDNYCNAMVSEGYLETEDIENIVPSRTSLESLYLKGSVRMIESILANTVSDANDYYSIDSTTTRISKQLIGLYVKPEKTNVEAENARREAIDKDLRKNTGKTTTQVDPSKVPDKDKVKPKTTYKDEFTGKEISGTYAEGLSAGYTDGNNAALSQQRQTGSIPGTIGSGPNPSGNYSEDYKAGYREGYAYGWNQFVADAKAAQSAPTVTYEETTPQEIVIEETTTTVVPTGSENESNNETFIPVDGGEEIIEEETDVIGSLKELKMQLMASYAMAYVDDYYENNNNAKRM